MVASVEMMFSLNPSARWSCALSPVKLLKGRTTIDGFVGSGKAMRSTEAGSTRSTQGCHQTAPPTMETSTATTTAMAGIRQRFPSLGFVAAVAPTETET